MQRLRFLLGIIEIAFALKFFSIADQAYGWNMLSPTLFLIIWAALALILAARLIKKPLIAILPLIIAIYLIQGIFTKQTALVSAFLPTPCGNVGGGASASQSAPALFHDYDEGVAYAKQTNKRIFLNFTGYGCVNCRKMEATVLKDEEVIRLLRDYVIIELYVDDRSPIPAATVPATVPDASASGSHRYHELGEKWADLEATRFHSVSQPLYVILSPQGKQLKAPIGYTPDVEEFINFLK